VTPSDVLLLLLVNLFLSVAVATIAIRHIRCSETEQRRLLWLLLVMGGVFIPLFGTPAFAWAFLSGLRGSGPAATTPYRPLGRSQYDSDGHEEGSNFDRGGLRARVTKQEVAPEKRLQSLAVLQNLPPVAASPVLRTLLDDDVEDIRLVAFGMLEKEEKTITEQIHTLLQQPEPSSSAARFQREKQLAELYWELAYSGLVLGDLRRYTLEHALEHARAALSLNEKAAGLCLLTGRILYALERLEEAETQMQLATALGIPEARILPYLAEFAFRRGDFSLTRQLLSTLGNTPVTPRLRPVLDFWQERTAL